MALDMNCQSMPLIKAFLTARCCAQVQFFLCVNLIVSLKIALPSKALDVKSANIPT